MEGFAPPTPPLMSAFGLQVDLADPGQRLGGKVLSRNWVEVKDEEDGEPERLETIDEGSDEDSDSSSMPPKD